VTGVVEGVTRLGLELYVLVASDGDQLHVYSTDFQLLRTISVVGLSSTGVCDVASCRQNNRLYLSNMDKNLIHVVVPKPLRNKKTKILSWNKNTNWNVVVPKPLRNKKTKILSSNKNTNWTLADRPCGLSVMRTGCTNSYCTVLFTSLSLFYSLFNANVQW